MLDIIITPENHGAMMTLATALATSIGTSLHLPSRATLPVLGPVIVVAVGFAAYCLVDLIRAPSVRSLPKPVWALVILLVSFPLGAIVYLVWGRDRYATTAPDAAPAAADRDVSAVRQSDPVEQRDPVRQSDATAAVTTSGLTRDYGGTGLFDVDLFVPSGAVYGLVGPNGAGKTTLLSILTELRRPDRGTVAISVPHERVAVCPDVPEFDGWLTAHEVVELAQSLIGHDGGADGVERALAASGLADAAGRRVGGFSRGMTQRLGLACALVGEPQLLLLDEPTSALDPAGRAEVLDLVAALRGSCTVIFSSHILADVQRVADHVGILRNGRLLYQGGTQDLLDTYLQPSWQVRLAGDPRPVVERLHLQPWVVRVQAVSAGIVRVDARSLEAGERGIPEVVAACRARLVACEPLAADLETAFLNLTTPRTGDAAC